jgi:hypothetical protein
MAVSPVFILFHSFVTKLMLIEKQARLLKLYKRIHAIIILNFKTNIMKTTFFNLFSAVVISGLALTSCSKIDPKEITPTPNAAATADANDAGKPATTTASILNQNLKISYARDNGVDITAQFRDFSFEFNGTYPSGNAHVWNDLLAQTGKWSSPTESTDFVLWYPTDIFTQLNFLNREWTIVEGGTSFFRLMAADGDEVDFLGVK